MSGFEKIVIDQLSNINKKFDKIDERFNEIDKKFDKIDERFKEIDKKFDKIDERFNEIDDKFDNLRDSVVLLENKVLSEFPALFEAFEVNRKLQEDEHEKIAYLCEKIEEHSIRITALENKMKVV